MMEQPKELLRELAHTLSLVGKPVLQSQGALLVDLDPADLTTGNSYGKEDDFESSEERITRRNAGDAERQRWMLPKYAP